MARCTAACHLYQPVYFLQPVEILRDRLDCGGVWNTIAELRIELLHD